MHKCVHPQSCCISCASIVPTPTAVLVHNLAENEKDVSHSHMICSLKAWTHTRHVLTFVGHGSASLFPPNQLLILHTLCTANICDQKLTPPKHWMSPDGFLPYSTSTDHQPTPIPNCWYFHNSRSSSRYSCCRGLNQWPFRSWMVKIHRLNMATKLCIPIFQWKMCVFHVGLRFHLTIKNKWSN